LWFDHIGSENYIILPKYGQFPPQIKHDLQQGKSGQPLLQMRSSFLNQLKIYLFNPSSNHQGLTKLSTSPYFIMQIPYHGFTVICPVERSPKGKMAIFGHKIDNFPHENKHHYAVY